MHPTLYASEEIFLTQRSRWETLVLLLALMAKSENSAVKLTEFIRICFFHGSSLLIKIYYFNVTFLLPILLEVKIICTNIVLCNLGL